MSSTATDSKQTLIPVHHFILGGPTLASLCIESVRSFDDWSSMHLSLDWGSQPDWKCQPKSWEIEYDKATAYTVIAPNEGQPVLAEMEVQLILTCPAVTFSDLLSRLEYGPNSFGIPIGRRSPQQRETWGVNVERSEVRAWINTWTKSNSPVLSYDHSRRDAHVLQLFLTTKHRMSCTMTEEQLGAMKRNFSGRMWHPEVRLEWSAPFRSHYTKYLPKEVSQGFQAILANADTPEELKNVFEQYTLSPLRTIDLPSRAGETLAMHSDEEEDR